MRRLVAMGCGLVVAVAAAVLALPTFVFAAALLHGDLAGLPQSMLDVVVWWAWADGSGRVLHQAVAAAAKAMAFVCLGPVILVALVGEATGLRSALWFVGATAGLTVALPVVSRAAPLLALAQPGAIGPLAATGAVAGLAYWLVAAPSGRPAPQRKSADGLILAVPAKSATENHDA